MLLGQFQIYRKVITIAHRYLRFPHCYCVCCMNLSNHDLHVLSFYPSPLSVPGSYLGSYMAIHVADNPDSFEDLMSHLHTPRFCSIAQG